MKHLKKGRKFSREKGQRKALLKIMLSDFLLKGKMKTTEAKAKELKKIAEKIISAIKKASPKKENISKIRQIRAQLAKSVNTELLEDISKKFATRSGGYVRVIRLGQRKSDGANMAILEMTESDAAAVPDIKNKKE